MDDPLLAANFDDAAKGAGQTLAAGQKLGRYTVMDPIGSGGMGAVYRARDEKLERVVAIKVLSPGVVTGDEARRRFRSEALALAKLSHPHIAAVYDVGEQDGVDYLVMECVAGQTLSAMLRSGPLSVERATSIILEIAGALEEAHEQGVIHRDLKPGNVMITPKGHAKVLDFGIAKLLAPLAPDATVSMETGFLIGTPLYMSPEQAQGNSVDARTDLWSLGVIYFQLLTGRTPFEGDSNIAILHAIVSDPPKPLRGLRTDAPALANQIIGRSLQKDADSRYQTAAEFVGEGSALLVHLSSSSHGVAAKRQSRAIVFACVAALLLTIVAAIWFFHRSSKRQWAREEAVPQIASLVAEGKPLAAFGVLEKAQSYLPGDPAIKQLADQNTLLASVTSSPAGATAAIQDYTTPDGPWRVLGTTPLENISVPKGFFRWKISSPGTADLVEGLASAKSMNFAIDAQHAAPAGMVPVPGENWVDMIAFIGVVGPYRILPFYLDRFEVTNRDYQKFVDSGGYAKQEYWNEKFIRDGREIPWTEAVGAFRDTTSRPGPAGWVGGHYAEGQADFPVSGVSWFEASAYAAFVGKRLPVLPQWYMGAPPDDTRYIVPVSNIPGGGPAPVGAYQGVGPNGTYDMAGNVREWVANADDNDNRFILGGSWKSPTYFSYSPEALSPFDRSQENGFRCVKNTVPLPPAAVAPIKRIEARDFSKYKPASDDVFHAYQVMYASSASPLNVLDGGVVSETADWREERVTLDTGYRGERMAVYLFLPKKVRPPYQTVVFFPSARVYDIADNKNGRALGDIQFFDYIIQSGRAVAYPIFQDTYERRLRYSVPGASQAIQLTTDLYHDTARTLDYLGTRSDIDSSKLAYLGVSMGAAEGIIYATLLQDRLKTSIFLDGGYFLDPPPPGGDQADFAPRMKKPVLMVNGRYDYVFSVNLSQDPMFNMLGTPQRDKQHIVLETSHDVTEQRPQLVKGVLDWLDRYLGPVNE
ncbi:MAG TPA: bifunctional serine/threonine-protein kinase/formylglycine-generating enzyme family protein [Acidobacteriaceae bacterium]|nr:bifunctional serine/threonine-protein kinase/formylglycine-generating enzyme family protein [Acidobacteriaceae bacterium]